MNPETIAFVTFAFAAIYGLVVFTHIKRLQ